MPRSFGDRRRAPDHLADDRVVARRQIVQRRDVSLRYDEHVRRSLRVDVVEREHAIVLVDDRRRDLARDDLAEEAVGHQRLRAIAVRAILKRHSFPSLSKVSTSSGRPKRAQGRAAFGIPLIEMLEPRGRGPQGIILRRLAS